AGEIYVGAYEPDAPGGIRWNSEPEYRNPDFDGGPFRRCQGFCTANDVLHASVAPCLLKRQDGDSPVWQEVFRWEPENRAGAGLRGITAVPSPGGRDHEVILASREQEGQILRIDPVEGYRATLELESDRFFADAWNQPRAGGRLVAYNRFIPGVDPTSGDPVHWITALARKHDDMQAAWLLIRHADSSYDIVRVYDEHLSPHPRLVSTRTLEHSPWDDRVIYVGGYDGGANNRENYNTAWIFRGVLPHPIER
ncbi:MAG: hypothetical protein ACOC0P_02185, partial [Planctomycetota bacterium]